MLRVRLFGGLEVDLDGVPVEQPASCRAWGLLAWLAPHPGLSARARVAACFWPDVLDSSARASLRTAIWALRPALGPAADTYLRVTRDAVGLNQAGQLWVDVAAYRRRAQRNHAVTAPRRSGRTARSRCPAAASRSAGTPRPAPTRAPSAHGERSRSRPPATPRPSRAGSAARSTST